jgi:predicted esterase
MKIIGSWRVEIPNVTKRCIITLPGRSTPVKVMMDFCEAMELPDTMIVGLQSKYHAWYPAPNGINDQTNAVDGMKYVLTEINDTIARIKKTWKLRDGQICLLGHSAGAVMAIQSALSFNFKSVVSLAGAILVPEDMPECTIKTKFFIQNNTDDDCFEWHERFLPMQNALELKKYNTDYCIDAGMKHNSFTNQVLHKTREFICQTFSIKEEIVAEESKDAEAEES